MLRRSPVTSIAFALTTMSRGAPIVPLLDLFWTTLWFFLFFAWIWALVLIFGDIFRSRDLSGWGKALWTIFVVLVPWLGVLVYLIVRGGSMAERNVREAAAREQATQQYIQSVASQGTSSTADEIGKLAQLRDSGVLTPEEFDAQKTRILAVN
jgi:hypothetical protein